MTGAAALDAASAEGAAAIAALPDLPPADAGTVLRDGTAIAYAAWGAGDRTLLLLPAWQVVDSTIWAAQIRRFAPVARVVTFDARGSGRSGRPTAAGAYAPAETNAERSAVLDAWASRKPTSPASASRPLRRPDGRPAPGSGSARGALMAPTAPFGPPHIKR